MYCQHARVLHLGDAMHLVYIVYNWKCSLFYYLTLNPSCDMVLIAYTGGAPPALTTLALTVCKFSAAEAAVMLVTFFRVHLQGEGTQAEAIYKILHYKQEFSTFLGRIKVIFQMYKQEN
jgi:hypothetical protein